MELKSPREYGFKFDKYRDIQKKAIEKIAKSIEKGKRYIITELPTGSGKSLIAMTIHKLYSTKTYVVVSTKTLQNQYMNEFRIPTVKGRNNFHCLIRKELTVDKAPCNIRKCHLMSRCPYYVQRNKAISAPVSIHNYSYFLSSMNYTNAWSKADLIVFDEAHTMDNHMTDFISLRIPKSILDIKSRNNTVYAIEDALADLSIEIDNIRESLLEYNEESEIYKTYMEILNDYINYQRKLKIIMNAYDKTNFIVEETKKSWVFRPVWPSPFSDMYFSHGDIFLMMSATIGSVGVFMKLLGIPDNETVFIRGTSTFDVRNRPLLMVSGPSLNIKNINDELPNILKKVDKIIEIEENRGNLKGIIHTPSYKVTKYIVSNSRYRSRMYTHDSNNRDSMISGFILSDDGILVSPSVHTGMDFKYDIARWQIITKVPYADLGDKLVKRRFIENPKWYTQDAIIRVVQSYGRIVRDYDDWGTTYILDGNINHLVNNYSYMFPSWFLDAFKFCELKGDMLVCKN